MSDMTSAVAIDLLDNLIGMVDDNQENDYDTALHMAIDALKAQAKRTDKRTETHACDCIDQIDREPTIEPRCETCEAFNKTRLLIPQPERKKGWWIEHNPHKWGLGIVFECSECGEKIDCEPSNFCPNCGADMREDGEADEAH